MLSKIPKEAINLHLREWLKAHLALERKDVFKAEKASSSMRGCVDAVHIAHAIGVFSIPNPVCSA